MIVQFLQILVACCLSKRNLLAEWRMQGSVLEPVMLF